MIDTFTKPIVPKTTLSSFIKVILITFIKGIPYRKVNRCLKSLYLNLTISSLSTTLLPSHYLSVPLKKISTFYQITLTYSFALFLCHSLLLLCLQSSVVTISLKDSFIFPFS